MTAKRLAILKAIRDGKPYTKANKVLAPLSAAGLITVVCKPDSVQYASAKLTEWGKSTVKFYETRRLP
jgi:hypothetical protein